MCSIASGVEGRAGARNIEFILQNAGSYCLRWKVAQPRNQQVAFRKTMVYSEISVMFSGLVSGLLDARAIRSTGAGLG